MYEITIAIPSSSSKYGRIPVNTTILPYGKA